MEPPVADAAPGHDRAPRPHPRRRLRVAARQGRPRGDGLPRGRERLHPGAHRPPRRPAAGDLRRDQGPHPRDRPVGADPQPRLLVLRPLLRGQGVRRQLPGPGRRPRTTGLPRSPAEDCAPDQPALPGEEVLLDLDALAEGHEFFSLGGSAVSPDSHAARLLHRHHRRRALHGPGQGPARPASCCDDEITGVLGGATWDPRRPGLLLHDRRRVLARPTRSGGTGSAPPRPTTSWSTTRPTAGSGSASAAPAPTGSW